MKKSLTVAQKVAFIGIGIALYFVLGLMVKIPLIGHIQTDLGYIAFGAWLMMFGWESIIVGVLGCLLESLIVSGWVPAGWMLGQLFIGLVCGWTYKHTKNKLLVLIVTVLSVFVGIGLIKTGVECVLYNIPFEVKFIKNWIAFIADTIPMLIGVAIAELPIMKSLLSNSTNKGWA